jgi:3-oxoacyl-[acyl-carrier-protein] synthase-1
MTRDVHVVAVGARTPLGLTAESAAAAMRAGINRLTEHPFMVDANGDRVINGVDPILDPAHFGVQRLVEIASTPLLEVAAKLSEKSEVADPVTCLLGLPEERPGFTDADASLVAQALEGVPLQGLSRVNLEAFGRGHAAALAGLVEARRRIERGQSEVCIVGGVDSYLHHETLDWLQANRQLATADARSAFFPGEGAGFVALASDRARRQHQWPSLATLEGTGLAYETTLIKTDGDNFGEGLTQAVVAAAARLRVPDELIDEVYCDINGERYRSEEWGFVLLRAAQLFRDGTGYKCPAGEWGDMGAASGALFVMLAVASLNRGDQSAAMVLAWAGSEGGVRAAALLAKRGAE